MADGVDIKGIGFAVKDLVLGIAAAGVGAAGGGQAGAAGVMKAGEGIDKIVAMATGGDSRAQRFDRTDFEAKPQRPSVAPPAKVPPAPTDRDQTIAHLQAAGWSREQIDQILAGPEKYAMEHIDPIGPVVEGQRVPKAARGPQKEKA